MTEHIPQLIDQAIQKRAPLIQPPYQQAFRLINGFLEDLPNIVIEIFGKTAVIHDYSADNDLSTALIPILKDKLPWIESGVVKKRRSKRSNEQAGRLAFGDQCDTDIIENETHYAIDLTMNQDASFYLDTRNLRSWLKANMANKTVLNTFAYTGSLGVAALAGGAREVIQLDLNRRFLGVAKRSAKLNGFTPNDSHYHSADFWSRVNQYKTTHKRFDCVILDPPVYSKTSKGIIDVTKNYHRLINKVRPIINDGGTLITINNALFQSGQEHHDALSALCTGPYLKIDHIIPVPADCTGTEDIASKGLPADPTPYNHSTKITVLRIKTKQAMTDGAH